MDMEKGRRMASNNNNNIVVNITGNSQGLTTAVNQAQTSLGNLRSAAQGNLKSITSSMAGMSGAAAVSFAGATAVLAGFTFALKSTADATRQAMELMQLTAKSNMSAEGLQQMANMYRQTGLTMDNISDQQKDIKDKIADGLTNAGGSMYTDVIQPLKLNLIQLQQMADAGEDVYAKSTLQQKHKVFLILNLLICLKLWVTMQRQDCKYLKITTPNKNTILHSVIRL